jgi:ornithine decarboxylase
MMDGMPCFRDAARAVAALRPELPLHCLRPHIAADQARRMQALFTGPMFYAVKANPAPVLLDALWSAGVRAFDAASIDEIALLRARFPAARIGFMNPIKPRAAIGAAYHDHAVRIFSFDSAAELAKISQQTGGARDLTLLVRIAAGHPGALWPMSSKFGASPADAVVLLRAARLVAQRVGLAFHVGSLCLSPEAYGAALINAGAIAVAADVRLDVIDIGGGFPIAYDGILPPPIDAYADAVAAARAAVPLAANGEMWTEPGRCLAGPAGSLVVQVIARNGRRLYINDGVFGGLAAPGPPSPGFGLPARRIGSDGAAAAFTVFGPTCDGSDRLNGALHLPDDIAEGDWIEIGQHGAYGACLRSNFNGLLPSSTVLVADGPLLHTPGFEHQ